MLWGYQMEILKYSIIFLIISSLLANCAPSSRHIYLIPIEHAYVKSGNDYLVFDNGLVRISLKSVKGTEKADIGEILRYEDIEAFVRDYHIIRMDMVKLVENNVTVNFDAIYLILNPFNQKQPLNYFDLYTVAERNSDNEMRKFIRSWIKKGRVTLSYDQPTESYLIFPRLDPDEQTATLTFNDFYADHSSFNVEIPFSVNISYDQDVIDRMGF